jgi:hypothetical protein
MPAPQQIIELVNRFERNYESYKSGNYNETQTRREFIDRLAYELYGLTEEEIKIVESPFIKACDIFYIFFS